MSFTHVTSIGRLVGRLEDDIHRKALWAGDPYLTSNDVGEMLGVSRSMANRALKLMADRGLLVRRARQGTFVGPHFPVERKVATHMIQVLLPTDCDFSHSLSFDALVSSIQKAMPGASVKLGFLPWNNPIPFVERLVEEARKDSTFMGVLAVSCGRDVYAWLEEHQIPTTVIGTLHSSANLKHLAAVDVDHRVAGQLLAEYLLGRGHRRLALLMEEHWRPGDNLLHEGIVKAMGQAGLPVDALAVRSMPTSENIVRAEVHRLLEQEDGQTGIISWDVMFCDIAIEVAKAMGRNIETVLSPPGNSRHDLKFTSCQSIDFCDRVTVALQLLSKIVEGEAIDKRQVFLPVELVEFVEESERGCN